MGAHGLTQGAVNFGVQEAAARGGHERLHRAFAAIGDGHLDHLRVMEHGMDAPFHGLGHAEGRHAALEGIRSHDDAHGSHPPKKDIKTGTGLTG